MRVLVASCAIVVLLVPANAAAQDGRQAFATGVLALTSALEGANGDEGPRVTAALASMVEGLVQWDLDLQRLEAQVAAALHVAGPGEGARLHAGLGLAYAERGRVADALEAFDQAVRTAPREPMPYLFRGLVQAARDPEDAARAFKRAWELDRDDPVKAYWLVQSAHDAGTIEGVAPALETLAAAYRRMADQAGAPPVRPFLQTALFQDDATEVPIFPLVRYLEGYARLVAGEFDRALASLQAAAAADPLVTDPALRAEPALRGMAELKHGRAAEAIVHLERAVAMAPTSSEAHRVLGIAYRTAGRIPESVARLEEAVRLDRHNERACIELVSVLDGSGSGERSHRALEEAIGRFPTSGSLRWMHAVLARRLDNEEEMLRQLDAVPVASMLAGKGQVWAAIGRLHVAGLRAAAAERPFRDAVLANANNAAAHMDLGELYRTEGAAGPALAAFVAALLIAPGVAEAHTAVGQIHLAEGRTDDAIVAFRRAVALNPEHPDAQYGLASALLRLGRTDQAAPHLEAFNRLARRRAEALRSNYELFGLKRQATFYEDEGRYEDAVAAWRAVVDREPEHAENHLALGEALVAAGHVDLGIQSLERAAALHVAGDVYRRLAELYAARGLGEQSARAQAEYERRQADAFRRRTSGH